MAKYRSSLQRVRYDSRNLSGVAGSRPTSGVSGRASGRQRYKIYIYCDCQ